VARQQASKPFVSDDNQFIAFCLACRTSGIAASTRLEIANPAVALDLDLAVALRLQRYDNERAKDNAILIANEVSKIFGSSESGESGGDKYGEAFAERW